MDSGFTAQYELLITEEETLIEKIKTCESCVVAVLDAIVQNGDGFHAITTEEILTLIHNIGSYFHTELLHLRLEKSILASSATQVDISCI
ncbi:hypothetical protein OB236_10010 [Paenibacillus sp. WQ 127069]|uniref:Uncharacterized protein n=1 Tax=Paenibacillus baimaensis TaxID=2982185 RepID=A0ABT2UF00_9BACL|nr:hypothetical protein [Paenibacillus sp. WQ 127069]MCU6792462.1 hypothetical protein [Paenibacillus sp. WQ 127069]